MNPKGITPKELSEILSKSIRWVNSLASREGWLHQKLNSRGDKVFQIPDLPPEIQERIRRHELGIESDDVMAMAEACKIRLDPSQAASPKAAAKVRMVCECLAVPKSARGRRERISQIAESYGYNRATAYRLIDRAQKGEALEKSSKNYGHTFENLNITVRAWDPEAARLALEALAGNRRNRAEKLSLYNSVSAEAKTLGLNVGSYGSFLDISRKISPAILKYRDAGKRGLREDILPAIRRDFTAYRAMECLIGDQHKADYYCLDAQGQIVTLELFCWLDFRTQMAWGAIAYKHYNRYTVGSALLNAVRHGIPSMVYTDWGKPEESDYMTQLVAQLTGLGAKTEQIRHVNAIVRNPQAKPIESWFGNLDAKIRNIGLPGYCKRLTDGRENELQQKEIKEQIRAEQLLGIHEVTSEVFRVIEQWNGHIFKNRGEDTDKSPEQVYREETAKHPVTVLSDDVLSYIFLPSQTTKVSRSQIKVKHPWMKTLTYYSPDLSGYGKEEVEVRFDPFDQGHVHVFERKDGRTGRLICTAEEWAMINPKVTDQVTTKIHAQRSLEKQIRGIYEEYRPTGEGEGSSKLKAQSSKQIRRIHPAERQAREVAQVRVMKTQIEQDQREEQVEQVAAANAYRPPLVFRKQAEPTQLRPLFRLNMDSETEEEDTV